MRYVDWLLAAVSHNVWL